jgi:N-acetylglucosaminyldiphosphoundecaprenol N-acetyl-beta-D-mannosaminyltransferase
VRVILNTKQLPQRANVLGIGIDAVNMEQALARVANALSSRQKGYVCFAGVHGVMEAQRDPTLANIYVGSMLAAPDGMPTVWVGRQQGYKNMERVAGPDLMFEVISRKEFRGYSHFLCGGKDGIAQELRDELITRCPGVKIIGAYTPPFGPMSQAQEREFVAMIEDLKPDVIWVGISTPKQERFMAHYLPILDTTLMFGVGAAFDFHTGRIADCADWIKKAGLQWLHRLIQDPKHLWKRYLRNNPPFLFYSFLQLVGLKSYPLREASEIAVASTPVCTEPHSLRQ